jgi:HlyD family secretion protein
MKWLIALVAGSATCAALAFDVWNFHDVPPERFRTAPVERGDLLVAVHASGTLVPAEIVDVGSQVEGRIRSLGEDIDDPGRTIDYGSRVKKGTVLARIEDSNFLARLERMQASLAIASAELKVAEAQLRQAEREWHRSEALGNVASRAERDLSMSAYEVAKETVAVAKARVSQATAEVKQAKVDLEFATIESPIDGVVIDRRVHVGQTVVAGLDAPSLFLLGSDLDQLEIWASVNEADLSAIRAGQRVDFTVDAFPDRTFTGEVAKIRLNARMTQNVVTYTVVVVCNNPERKLLPYMTANLKFEVARREQVLLVPSRALRWRPALEQVAPPYRQEFLAGRFQPASSTQSPTRAGDGSPASPSSAVLWTKLEDGLLRPLPVQLGLTDRLRCEVVGEGLAEGRRVVTGEVVAEDDIGNFTSTFVRLPKKE